MGLNYYLVPSPEIRTVEVERRLHVGKMVSNGTGKGRTFLWAMRPFDFVYYYVRAPQMFQIETDESVVDVETLMGMLRVTDVQQDHSNIGQEFR